MTVSLACSRTENPTMLTDWVLPDSAAPELLHPASASTDTTDPASMICHLLVMSISFLFEVAARVGRLTKSGRLLDLVLSALAGGVCPGNEIARQVPGWRSCRRVVGGWEALTRLLLHGCGPVGRRESSSDGDGWAWGSVLPPGAGLQAVTGARDSAARSRYDVCQHFVTDEAHQPPPGVVCQHFVKDGRRRPATGVRGPRMRERSRTTVPKARASFTHA